MKSNQRYDKFSTKSAREYRASNGDNSFSSLSKRNTPSLIPRPHPLTRRNFLGYLGNKPKKFDIVHQTISGREEHLSWA